MSNRTLINNREGSGYAHRTNEDSYNDNEARMTNLVAWCHAHPTDEVSSVYETVTAYLVGSCHPRPNNEGSADE